MRIVIDMQGAQTESRFRGIGRYSYALALAMARNAGGHDIWLVLNAAFPESISDIRRAFAGIIPKERLRVFDIPAPVAECDPGNAWRARAAEKIREHFIQTLQPDAVLVTSLFEGDIDNAATSIGTFCGGAKIAVILYDLIPLLNPEDYLAKPAQRQYYERKIESLKKAGLLLAISEYSRREAIEALGLAPGRVVNISTAADPHFKPGNPSADEISALRRRLGITRKVVMYAPGGFDLRKNLDGLITAYSLLSERLRGAHQLVVVSKLGEQVRPRLEQIRKCAGLAADELILTGYVTENELRDLYRDATLFVFPSKHEGFGLPALEAMACGAPVIGANNTSIPEVIGNAEALFDASAPQSIADKMAQVLQDGPMRDRLRGRGIEQAGRFSWDETARRAIGALEELVRREEESTGLSIGKISAGTLQTDSTEASLVDAIAGIDTAVTPAEIDLVRVADCIAFNSGRDTPGQLMLDISEIAKSDGKTGIQRVVRSLLRELLEYPPQQVAVVPIYFDGTCYRTANKFVAALRGECSPEAADEIADFCQDDIYLALDLNEMTQAVHNAQMRLMSRGVQFYFIVYDILLLHRPDWWPAGCSAIFETWLRSISTAASGLICISESVAQDVRTWLSGHLPSHAPAITVASFHLGADIGSSLPTKGLPDNAAAVLDSLGARASFLIVGTLEPRKGHAQALAAFEYLWHRGIAANLVIVGKQGWMVDKLADKLRRHPESNQHLFWLEGISDEYLEKIYAASRCLIAASEGEGFGLPIIEAAQHKLPIIARDIPVFREVAGEHAFYFRGLEASDLADAIGEWLSLNGKGQAPQSAGLPWLTWRESAQQLIGHIDLTTISGKGKT